MPLIPQNQRSCRTMALTLAIRRRSGGASCEAPSFRPHPRSDEQPHTSYADPERRRRSRRSAVRNAYDPGMLKRLHNMPDGVVGFRIDGDVEQEDYTQVVVPALKAAVDSGRGLRTLYLIEDLDDIEDAALWEDTKLGYDLVVQHRGDWKRTAIVTDIDWMARASRLFLWLFPGEARLFRVNDLQQAKAWVAG
jgi:SpoIIAA-like